jgi:hypothetical protein
VNGQSSWVKKLTITWKIGCVKVLLSVVTSGVSWVNSWKKLDMAPIDLLANSLAVTFRLPLTKSLKKSVILSDLSSLKGVSSERVLGLT